MSKRAVTISYELLKHFLVKGYMIGLVECIEGIPEDAVCIDMFPDNLMPAVTMVFESDNWDSEPSKHTVDCLVRGKIPYQEIKHRKLT